MFILNLFFISVLLFVSVFFHVLMVLVSLELIILSVLMMVMFFSCFDYSFILGMYFLIFSVCESILGLSLVVLMVRYCGNEYMKSLSILF